MIISDRSKHRIEKRLKNKGLKPGQFLQPVIVRKSINGRSAYAVGDIIKGGIVYVTSGSRVNLPLVNTIQINKGVHIVGPGLIDHRCSDPTCVIDDNNNLIARRVIKSGEKITYNYLTTEFDIINKFNCMCGDKNCFGFIRGFKYLDQEERDRLINKLPISNYLQSKIQK